MGVGTLRPGGRGRGLELSEISKGRAELREEGGNKKRRHALAPRGLAQWALVPEAQDWVEDFRTS